MLISQIYSKVNIYFMRNSIIYLIDLKKKLNNLLNKKSLFREFNKVINID